MSRRLFFLIAALVLVLYLNFSIVLISLQQRGTRIDIVDTTSVYASSNSKSFRCKELRYRSPPLPSPVALVSFPGSGNTWLRHLLEESTGILTGSVYMDQELYKHFPAENVTDGSVLVVKMHEGKRFLRDNYRAAILMIRKPINAILSEFNRSLKGHKNVVKISIFESRDIIDWPDFVKNVTEVWESENRITLTQSQKPVYVVFYERLLKDTRNTLRGVLDFLNQTVSEEELDCAIKNGEGMFHREVTLPIDPFTHEMHEQISAIELSILSQVAVYMTEHNQTSHFVNTLGLDESGPNMNKPINLRGQANSV